MAKKTKKEKLEVTEAQLDELRAGVKLREHDLENARNYLTQKGLSTKDVDERLVILRGDGPTTPGLKALLGFRDESDPNQTDIEEELNGEDS